MPDLTLTAPVYINLDPAGPVLVKSSTNQLGLGPLRVVSGDERLFSFRLHQTPEGSTWQRVGLPSGWTMVLSGKRAPGGETAYFTNSTWATAGSGSTLAYTATLDWAVSDSIWANATDGVVPFRMDLEIRDAANTVRGTVQFDLELSRENYGSGDTPDDPDSPFLDRTAADNIYLSFAASQTLTEPNKLQAWTNLGGTTYTLALTTAANQAAHLTALGLGTGDSPSFAGLTVGLGSATFNSLVTVNEDIAVSGELRLNGSSFNIASSVAFSGAFPFTATLTGLTSVTFPTSGTLATQAYADALVVGLLDDRGNYDASGNVFPSSGGSGTAGAVLKGDLWTISAPGTIGGTPVTIGDVVRAIADAPGQTAANWTITENNLGYVPQNTAGTLALAGFSSITGTLPVANCPAASTSAAGVIELATTAEMFAAVSTSLGVTPQALMFLIMSPCMRNMPRGSNWTTITSGSGMGATLQDAGAQLRGVSSSTGGVAVLDSVNNNQLQQARSRGRHRYALDLGKLVWMSFRVLTDSDFWNANAIWRVTLGKPSTGTGSGIGVLGRLGIGVRQSGAGALDIIHFTSGSETVTASTFTPTYGQAYDVDLISLGNGTIYLYVNGTLYGTASGGPTSVLSDSTGGVCLQAEVEQVTSFISPQPIAYIGWGRTFVSP